MKIVHPNSPLLQQLLTDGAAELHVGVGCSLADAKLLLPGQRLDVQTVLAAEELDPSQVVSHLLDSGVNHLVQKNAKHFTKDICLSFDLLKKAESYFLNPGAFIAGPAEDSVEVTFSTTLDKAGMRRQISQFLAKISSQNVIESAEAVVEELYMNAMLDAPREAAKRGQVNCTYDLGLHSVMRLHLVKDRLIVSCEDPFGSLDHRRFLKRMSEVYKKGAGESINFREGGAGLGCVIMFEHSESLYLGVVPGQRTVVSCVIPVGMSYRQRAQVKKSIHVV